MEVAGAPQVERASVISMTTEYPVLLLLKSIHPCIHRLRMKTSLASSVEDLHAQLPRTYVSPSNYPSRTWPRRFIPLHFTSLA